MKRGDERGDISKQGARGKGQRRLVGEEGMVEGKMAVPLI